MACLFNCRNVLKEQFQNENSFYCHHLLTLMMFPNHMTFFFPQNTQKRISFPYNDSERELMFSTKSQNTYNKVPNIN